MEVPIDELKNKYSELEFTKREERWQIHIPENEYPKITEICSSLPEHRHLTFYEAGLPPSMLEIEDLTGDPFASKITNSRILAKYLEYILEKKATKEVTAEIAQNYLTVSHDMNTALRLQEELLGATLWTLEYDRGQITKIYRFTHETILTPKEYLRKIYLNLSCTECSAFQLSTDSNLKCPEDGVIELNPQSVDEIQDNICPNMILPFSDELENVTITSKRFADTKYANDYS